MNDPYSPQSFYWYQIPTPSNDFLRASDKVMKYGMLQTGTFNWDMKTQGLVLGAFFYGYTTTQIFGGLLAQKIGGKFLFMFGVGWTAVLTLLTPILTRAGGFAAIFAVRLLEGMGEVCVTF